MAIQRYYETTKDRLKVIFREKSIDPVTSSRYFKSLYPVGTGLEYIDVITGCLRFIEDENEGVAKYVYEDQTLEFSNGNCTFNTSNFHLNAEYIITFQNYRSSNNPSVVFKIFNNKTGKEDVSMAVTRQAASIETQNCVMELMMSVISRILATLYSGKF